jgi:hypothetical protein
VNIMAVKRARNPQGQQTKLSRSLTAIQKAQRQERIQHRSGTARAIGMINFGLQQFFGRGFFGRLKWLVTGR